MNKRETKRYELAVPKGAGMRKQQAALLPGICQHCRVEPAVVDVPRWRRGSGSKRFFLSGKHVCINCLATAYRKVNEKDLTG